jgi:hypothetical protein
MLNVQSNVNAIGNQFLNEYYFNGAKKMSFHVTANFLCQKNCPDPRLLYKTRYFQDKTPKCR